MLFRSVYSQTIVGRETLKELSEWHLRNPDKVAKKDIDPNTGEIVIAPGEYIMMFKKANEIGIRPLKGYYETLAKETTTSKYKNEYLDSTITEDPFRSLITTSNQINANFATQQFLKQAEDIFVKLYVEPGPKSKVTVINNNEVPVASQGKRNTLETLNDSFPFDRGQIRQKRENVEDYKQALRMYDKIRLARYGQGQRYTANLIRENLGDLADTLENHIDITNGLMTIPNMTIESTIGHFEFSGTQSMNEEIEYYIRVPWKLIGQGTRNKLFGTKKTSEGETGTDEIIEVDPNKKTRYLNLKMSGTLDDYKIRPGKAKKKKL